MVGVYFGNIAEEGVLIAKISRGGRVLKEIGEREGGSGRNRPSSSPFSRPEQGRGWGAPAAADSGPLGRGSGRD